MPDELPPRQAAGPDASDAENVAHLDQSLWKRLADATTPEEFCFGWLGLQSRMVGGVTGGAVVLRPPDGGQLAPVAFWPRRPTDPERFSAVLERALAERKGVVSRSDSERGPESQDDLRFRLAYPVLVGGEAHGAAVLEITPRPPAQLQAAMRQLQWGAAWLQNWVLRRGAEPRQDLEERLRIALEVTGLALEERGFRAAATVVTTALATRLDCDRVSIGFVKGRQVKVRALSHSADFKKQMNLIRAIGMAMGESVDQQAVLVYPTDRGAGTHVLYSHEQLARAHGDRSVCTVPFFDRDGKAFGAVTFERSAPVPFDSKTTALCEAVAALVGPVLDETRKNDRLLVLKAWDSLRLQFEKLVGPRHALRKLIVASAAILAVFFTFADGRYRVTAKSVLEGEVQRAVVAPYRGFIFDAAARAGDIVRRGQVMCRLDTRDLELELAKWSSEREQYLLEQRRSMADRDVAAMGVLGKRMQQSDAQMTLLREQIARAGIIAPFDGVVVSGDLSQSLGAPVEAGQVLFEVAPLDSYRVIVQVDEREIRAVREGQTGELVLAALPGSKLTFRVTQITPVTVSEEGRSYFRVEASLDQVLERLRPGMEGFGKIDVDRRRLIWIWTHDLLDWVRLRAWSLLP